MPCEQKQCYKCKQIKLLSEFYKKRNRPDGYDNRCKKCDKKRNRLDYSRRYYYQYKPKISEHNRIKKRQSRLKLRFKVLERDNFTCQYCGRKAPDVKLQVDHIYPKSKGGLDKKENYKTACKECNLGKSDSILQEFNQ